MYGLGTKPDKAHAFAGRSTNAMGFEITLENGDVYYAVHGQEVLSGLFWSSWGNVIGLLEAGEAEAFEPYTSCLKMFSYSTRSGNNILSCWMPTLTESMNQTTYGFLLGTIIIMNQELIYRIIDGKGIKSVVALFPVVVGKSDQDLQIRVSKVKMSKVTEGIVQMPENMKENFPARLYRISLAEAGFNKLWNFQGNVPTSARDIDTVIKQLKLGSVRPFGGAVEIPNIFTSLFFPKTECHHKVLSELVEKSMRSLNKVIILGKLSSMVDPGKGDQWRAGFYDDVVLDDSEVTSGMASVIMGTDLQVSAEGTEYQAAEKPLPSVMVDPSKVLRVLEYRTCKVKISADFPELEFIMMRTEGTKAFSLAPGKSIVLGDFQTRRFYKIFLLSWGYLMMSAEGKPTAELELIGLVRPVYLVK